MYAFAWLDELGRRLWLARDHAGMKPLYLWRGSQGVAFASEVRALAEAVRRLGGPVRLSAGALADFLRWGSVPEPGCVLEGAELLPPDTAIELDVATGAELRRVTTGTVRPPAPPAEPIEAVRGSLRRAVARHLVADTPVALFLSGGIDSGVLAAELASAGGAVPTAISVVLGSRGTGDELELVRSLAARYRLPLEVVPVDDWPSRLQGALSCYDQPSVDGLNTFLIAGVARSLGFKVALSGVGADEVFGGYRHLHRRAGWLQGATLRPAAGLAARLAERSGRPDLRRIGMLLDAAAHGDSVQRAWRRLLPEATVRRLLPHAPPRPLASAPDDPLRCEQETYLLNTLLRDTDVMGMAVGVEIRAPFLDPEVLATARAIGTEAVLARGKPPKWLLREGWAGALDAGRLGRPKTGFTLDVARWFRGEARPVLEEARHRLGASRWLDGAAVQAFWTEQAARLDSGHPAAWVPLMALLQLEQQFGRWGEPG
jgi:asparagine synthase (glutamine-hydrolysing)